MKFLTFILVINYTTNDFDNSSSVTYILNRHFVNIVSKAT